jgi:HlyD family secretion protein
MRYTGIYMSKFKTFLLKLKSKKFIIPAVIVLLLVAFMVVRGTRKQADTNLEVKRGDFVKSVSVSGKIVSLNEVELGFETSGTVVRVNKDVGDKVYVGETIVALDASELIASRQKAEAEVLSEQAQLAKLRSSNGDSTEVLSNRRLVVNTILDAYTKADDAIRNKVDQFYQTPRTAPRIKYTFTNYFATKDALNAGRASVEKILVAWQKEISALTVDSYKSSNLDHAFANLLAVKQFLDVVSFAANSFEISDNLSQSTVDKYRTDVATARANINEASSKLTTISDDLRSSLSEIPVAEARVQAAQAEVRSFDAQIAKTAIRAPFEGIISLQNAKMGQSVTSGEKQVALITSEYQIEAFIPEVSIAGVMLGNEAEVTLDAYPNDTFKATVSHIDPSETEKDGVSNYKIKLDLVAKDARMLPGMTVNVRIITNKKEGVISIPERSVIRESGKSYVMVIKGKEHEKREITVGERDGKGSIEVIASLDVGETIALDPTLVK